MLVRRVQLLAQHVKPWQSIGKMVFEAGHRAPSSIALRSGSAQMTYGELIMAADCLATELIKAGIAPDVPVAICHERSFSQIVALLAVLRAGGAFVPLDPSWPTDRLRNVVDDCDPPVVIAEPPIACDMPMAGRVVLSVHQAALERRRSRLRSYLDIEERNLAYIIYTSGSTGSPKGVEITHGNLLNLVSWHRKTFTISENDRASHLSGLGFDAAVWEVWPYLTAGATVSLVDETVRGSHTLLRDWLIDNGITIAFVPTPLAEPMIAEAWPPEIALRVLLTGGDTLHVRPHPDLPFTVVNNYGPTECTVVATSGIVSPDGGRGVMPTLGHPITNSVIHILDQRGRPAPAGEIGEIYIGGANVGRGYRNRPSLTAEKFTADRSWPDADDARIFRTGDLGCQYADGQITFHGRCDNQVKLRGYRIELDEISTLLNRHPLVAQSAVVCRDDGRGRTLVAYVVTVPPQNPDARALHEFLAAMLPEYMLPAAYIRLASLPLTENGKFNKTALPPPAQSDVLTDVQYRQPESALEKQLVALVGELLGNEQMGADDNFFLSGGHSLLGIQIVLRIRDAFGVEITLRDLFEAQTVAKLAVKVERLMIDRLKTMSEEEARQWWTS